MTVRSEVTGGYMMAVPENEYIVLPEQRLEKKRGERWFEVLRRWLVQCRARATLADCTLSCRNYCATRNTDDEFVLRGHDTVRRQIRYAAAARRSVATW